MQSPHAKDCTQQAVCQRSQKEEDSLALETLARRNCPIFIADSPHFHQSVFAVSPQLVRAGIEAMIELPLPLRQTQSPRASL